MSHECNLCSGATCPLCGEKCLKFEPPVLVCHGPCNQRIRRNSTYYVTPDGVNIWCQKCFVTLPGNYIQKGNVTDVHDYSGHEMANGVVDEPYGGATSKGRKDTKKKTKYSGNRSPMITVSPLTKRNNVLKRHTDEEVAEPWVSCDSCGHWVHQICALYRDRLVTQGTSSEGNAREIEYQCPLCKLEFAASAAVLCERKLASESTDDAVNKVLPATTRGRGRGRHPRAKTPSSEQFVQEPVVDPRISALVEFKPIDLSTQNVVNAQICQSVQSNNNNDHSKIPAQQSLLTDSVSSVLFIKPEVPISSPAQGKGFRTQLTPAVLSDVIKSGAIYEPFPANIPNTDCNDSETQESCGITTLGGSNSSSRCSDADVNSICPSVIHDPHGASSLLLNQPTDINKSVPSNKTDLNYTFGSMRSQHNHAQSLTIDDHDRASPLCSVANVETAFEGLQSFPTLKTNLEEPKQTSKDGDATSTYSIELYEDLKSIQKVCSNNSNNAGKPGTPCKSDSCSINPVRSAVPSEHEMPHSTATKWSAAALPRTRLGDFIECMVHERLIEAGRFDVVPTVTVRMTSNTAQVIEVPLPVRLNTMNADGTFVPNHLPYRQKCILLFQKIDGVDVCLFSLYVQEFDRSCPYPNKGCVYISYIDSIDYFRPLELRTLVYHELLVGYFKWVQIRGFRQGQLWACPPQRGDNFIFWCHPPHQRTPSRERLNSWYTDVLHRALRLDILSNISNLYSSNFYYYIKKEKETEHICSSSSTVRHAAKNSYISLQKQRSSIAVHGNSKRIKSTTELADESDKNKRREENELPCMGFAPPMLHGEEVPICPPVFEGEYWITSYLRIHNQILSRARLGGTDATSGKNCTTNLKKCKDVLKYLMLKNYCAPFNTPVDPLALGIPEYLQVVKQPMDLGTIKDSLRHHLNAPRYKSMLEFAYDVRLTFDNAILFNPVNHVVHQAAVLLKYEFHKHMTDVVNELIGMSLVLPTKPVVALFNSHRHNHVNSSSMSFENVTSKQVDDTNAHLTSELDIWLKNIPLIQDIPVNPSAENNNSVGGGFTDYDTPVEAPPSNFNRAANSRGKTSQMLARSFHKMNCRSLSNSNMANATNADCDANETRAAVLGMSQSMSTTAPVSATSETSKLQVNDTLSSLVDAALDKANEDCHYEQMQLSNEVCDTAIGQEKRFTIMNGENSRELVAVLCDEYQERAVDGSHPTPTYTKAPPNENSSVDVPTSSFLETKLIDNVASESFKQPQLGFRGAVSLMSDVSKSVLRIKDDLFVFQFTDATCASAITASTKKMKRSGSFASTTLNAISLHELDDEMSEFCSSEMSLDRDGGAEMENDNDNDENYSTSSCIDINDCSAGNRSKCKGKRGRKKGSGAHGTTISIQKQQELRQHERSDISPRCRELLSDIKPDTSDPDAIMNAPFVDSRHTFLEMCQYRHYQFDTLRRAKYSSLMVLHHLHDPYDPNARPHCASCLQPIRELRWHCDSCSNYDICDDCYGSSHLQTHEHLLTPFRVTFI